VHRHTKNEAISVPILAGQATTTSMRTTVELAITSVPHAQGQQQHARAASLGMWHLGQHASPAKLLA
jgi:hypothetical protein